MSQCRYRLFGVLGGVDAFGAASIGHFGTEIISEGEEVALQKLCEVYPELQSQGWDEYGRVIHSPLTRLIASWNDYDRLKFTQIADMLERMGK